MIEKFDHYFSHRDEMCHLHVYLPDDYGQNDRTYPIMTCILFYHRDATYGRSWGLKYYMDQSDRQMIIVGIECIHDARLAEYCPHYVEHGFRDQPIAGYGRLFMEWLVFDLKQMIDEKYRTQAFRETTGIGGSFMGGLMAFCSLIAFNAYFSKAAVISQALGLCSDQLTQKMNQQSLDPNSRAFFSYSQREIKRMPDALNTVGFFDDRIVEAGGQAYIHVEPNGAIPKIHGAGRTLATWNFCGMHK